MNMLFYLFFDNMYIHDVPLVSLDETAKIFTLVSVKLVIRELHTHNSLGCINGTLKH
jgi:hypothetical protein